MTEDGPSPVKAYFQSWSEASSPADACFNFTLISGRRELLSSFSYRLVHTQIRFLNRSHDHNLAKKKERFHLHGIGGWFFVFLMCVFWLWLGWCLFFVAGACVNFLKCCFGLCALREFDLSVCADIGDSI